MFQGCLKLLEGERERERGDLFQGCLKLLEGENEESCFRAVLNY